MIKTRWTIKWSSQFSWNLSCHGRNKKKEWKKHKNPNRRKKNPSRTQRNVQYCTFHTYVYDINFNIQLDIRNNSINPGGQLNEPKLFSIDCNWKKYYHNPQQFDANSDKIFKITMTKIQNMLANFRIMSKVKCHSFLIFRLITLNWCVPIANWSDEICMRFYG